MKELSVVLVSFVIFILFGLFMYNFAVVAEKEATCKDCILYSNEAAFTAKAEKILQRTSLYPYQIYQKYNFLNLTSSQDINFVLFSFLFIFGSISIIYFSTKLFFFVIGKIL